MDIGLLISPADCSAVSTSSSALSEKTLPLQSAQSGTFSALLKDVAQNLSDEQLPPLANPEDPIKPAPSTEVDDQATGTVLSGIAVALFVAVPDLPAAACPVAEKDEVLEGSTTLQPQSIESTPLLPQGVSVVALPALTGQQPGNSTLPVKPPPGSLITDQGLAPVMEDEGPKIVFPAASANLGVQSLERPSTGVQPLGMAQEQGAQSSTLPGQSLLVAMTGVSGGGEQDPFGADAQGAGDGTFFRFGESGAPESVTRGNQSQLFNGQFTSAMQAQSSVPGEGSSVVTPAADRLKMTQAFFGEDHSATMTSASGKVQSVHVELPSNGSAPLSIRISMTDQMVHTQFTTDQNDLGALLFTRQDQLQQNLAKSGLELGQFQVHIDQRGQQEALPDRQSRRNGEPPEQQPASQDRNQQAQDRERPNHRPPRALSLFA